MLPRLAAPRAARSLLLGLLGLLGLLLLLAAPGARGQAAPGAEPGTSPVEAPAGYPDPRRAGLTAAIPECGMVTVSSGRCDFRRLNSGLDRMQLHRPIVNIVNVLGAAAMTSVPQAYNGLRQVLKNTFNKNPAKPVSYKNPPRVAVSVEPRNGGPSVSATGILSKSIEKSVQAQGGNNAFRYKLQLQRGGDGNPFGDLPPGKCQVVIYGPCTCPAPPACTYADTACAAGSTCPGGTAVSAECADRSGFGENPCACTALQELAALSTSLPTEAPWNDLANAAYCQAGSLRVNCAPVDGVQLPTVVSGAGVSLAGALSPSLGELGSSLTFLDLDENAITSLPSEIGALTGLEVLWLYDNALTALPTDIGALTGLTSLYLYQNAITSVPTELAALTGLESLGLDSNQLTGVPAEFRTVAPSVLCYLYNNPGFSCANVGAGTSCCTGDDLLGNNCGEGLSGGPCYTG